MKKEKRALINESTTKITRITIPYVYPEYIVLIFMVSFI